MAEKFLIMRTEDGQDLPLPQYMSKLAAGMDLYANVHEGVVLAPGEIKLIPTGIRISIPEGYEAQIRPRSGLALKNGVGMVNSPGTVDADYRGEIKVILINHGKSDFVVERGARIAQMVICKAEQIEFIETDKLEGTSRGEGGFGHTG